MCQSNRGDKRSLPASASCSNYYRKKFQRAEAAIPELDIGRYNLRSKVNEAVSPDHPDDRRRTKGDHSGPEKEDVTNSDPTHKRSKIQTPVHKTELSGTQEWTI
ncbi:hypothetical protein TNCV_660551 [Trichonephila clavipes]|nr:hypothetical protein TNCV_660551 [Trichonephila clavipes]